MKRYLAPLLCIILILSGCSVKQQFEGTIPDALPDPVPMPSETESYVLEDEKFLESFEIDKLLAVSVPAVSEKFILEDGTELFSYTAQHMQLILPDEEIADKVILNFLNRIDAAQLDAETVLTSAQNDYQPDKEWFPYFYQIIYSPTRIDYGVLSLYGTQNSYSGGMHGSVSCVATNYDLTTGDVLTLGSIMHMDATKDDFIQLVIDKLDAVADEYYLFEGYEDGVRSRLGGDENLYEDFFFTSTGLNFFFSPYEIAPYSSGIITVEIPYSELPGLIYDGYFPAEREIIKGNMHAAPFMDTNMEQFSSMAEVTIAAGEEILVIYPNGNVEDVRISIPGNGLNLPEYTVFAALEMSKQNAVVMSLPEEDIDGITISYLSEGNIEFLSLGE